MLQITVPKRYNLEQLFYSGEKGFKKTKNGYYYYKNFEKISPALIENIKNFFNRANFSWYISEKGGQEQNETDSYVRIVCDYMGGKIYPIYKCYGEKANKDHVFFKGQELCTVEIFFEKQWKYKITHYIIDKYTGEYSIDILYESSLKSRHIMPKSLKKFEDAIEAGLKKIKDYQCVKTYYSL